MGKMSELHRKLSEGEPLTQGEIAAARPVPYLEGWSAYARGALLNRNPYPHSELAEDWQLGWMDACAYYDEEDGRD